MKTALAGVMALSATAAGRAQGPALVCTSATAICTEWITLGGGPARSMIYRTYSLDAPNEKITRALIMVHGTNRNADHYFATATAAAFLAGALEDTVVIAPHFSSHDGSCSDSLQTNEVSWSCGGDSWRSGGTSSSHKDVTSFDFMDELLRRLGKKNAFPNLRAIVVAGHSAGGQFVTRYEMSNHVHETLGVAVAYVVANPSSYSWPDSTRAKPEGDAAPDSVPKAPLQEGVHTNFVFGPVEGSQCQTSYNRWPYGLENRTGGYTAKMTDDQLKKQLVSRPTTYLLGQVDTLPLGGFDNSCPANAQGTTRRARGEAFAKYVNEQLGARHTVQIVPACGHNDRCVFTTDQVLPVIFPKK